MGFPFPQCLLAKPCAQKGHCGFFIMIFVPDFLKSIATKVKV